MILFKLIRMCSSDGILFTCESGDQMFRFVLLIERSFSLRRSTGCEFRVMMPVIMFVRNLLFAPVSFRRLNRELR